MFSQWLTDHQDELLKFVSGKSQNHELLVPPSPSPSPPVATVLPSSNLPADNGSNNNNYININYLGQINCKKPAARFQGRKRKASSTSTATAPFDRTGNVVVETPADYLKKIIHRNIERQRRQEMAALYQSLRSQIPPEFLQGKRSIADHIHGTIRYIRYMQKKMGELKNKRDRLNMQDYLINPSKRFADSDHHHQTNIQVKSTKTGMEITFSTVLINPTTGGGGLPLSKVLNVLVLEGMSIKNSISTLVHRKMLHIIHIDDQVDEERKIDPSQLEGKLMSLVLSQ